jgi:hypothetical protein
VVADDDDKVDDDGESGAVALVIDDDDDDDDDEMRSPPPLLAGASVPLSIASLLLDLCLRTPDPRRPTPLVVEEEDDDDDGEEDDKGDFFDDEDEEEEDERRFRRSYKVKFLFFCTFTPHILSTNTTAIHTCNTNLHNVRKEHQEGIISARQLKTPHASHSNGQKDSGGMTAGRL